MIWEWIGLGVLFFLLRQTITTRQIRQRFLLSVVSVAVVLSSLGFWQHYIWYPQAVKAYDEVRVELCVGGCQKFGAVELLDRVLSVHERRHQKGLPVFGIVTKTCLDRCGLGPIVLFHTPDGNAEVPAEIIALLAAQFHPQLKLIGPAFPADHLLGCDEGPHVAIGAAAINS